MLPPEVLYLLTSVGRTTPPALHAATAGLPRLGRRCRARIRVLAVPLLRSLDTRGLEEDLAAARAGTAVGSL